MLGLTNAFVPQQITPGLNITVGSGAVYLAAVGTTLSLPQTTVVLAASATNYVYLDYGAGAFVANTTGFPSSCYQIATVVTNSTGVLTYVDSRVDFSI